ncbi:MAG: hypothetical protein LUQ69_09880 [Methanoregulaceae archaeon]|nr:hypothetical protein [Methanoregulaceae archaeon]
MIIIVDDYILIFTALAGILWGFVRYLMAPHAATADAPGAGRLTLWWALEAVAAFAIAVVVLMVVARMGTENPVSDVITISASALYAGMGFFLPRRGYRTGLAVLDKAILLLLAVLLLAGSLYDNLTR